MGRIPLPPPPEVRDEIVRRINAARAKNGLLPMGATLEEEWDHYLSTQPAEMASSWLALSDERAQVTQGAK